MAKKWEGIQFDTYSKDKNGYGRIYTAYKNNNFSGLTKQDYDLLTATHTTPFTSGPGSTTPYTTLKDYYNAQWKDKGQNNSSPTFTPIENYNFGAGAASNDQKSDYNQADIYKQYGITEKESPSSNMTLQKAINTKLKNINPSIQIKEDGIIGNQTINALKYLQSLTSNNATSNNPTGSQSAVPISNQTQYAGITKQNILDAGFNSYAELQNYASNKDNSKDALYIALHKQYGGDISNWKQQQIENDLGVHGRYHRGIGGDFSDMRTALNILINGWNKPTNTTNSNTPTTNSSTSFNGLFGVRNLLNSYGHTPKMWQPYVQAPIFTWSQIQPLIKTNNQIPSNKQGGLMINKYQDGGAPAPVASEGADTTGEESQEDQIKNLITAVQNGDQQAQQYLQQIMQAAQQGDPNAQQLAKLIQQVASSMQNQAVAAKHGAKLRYIKRLRSVCDDGEQLVYYKVGGKVCKKCMAKQMKRQQNTQTENLSPVEKFKKDKITKKEMGGQVKKQTTYRGRKLTAEQQAGRASVGKDAQGRPIYLRADNSFGPINKGNKQTPPPVNTPAYRKYYQSLSLGGKRDEDLRLENSDTKEVQEKCGGKLKKHLFGGKLLTRYAVDNAINRLKGN